MELNEGGYFDNTSEKGNEKKENAKNNIKKEKEGIFIEEDEKNKIIINNRENMNKSSNEYNDIKDFINTSIESNNNNNKKDNDYFKLDIDNNNNNINNKKEKSMESLKYSPICNTKNNEKSFIYNYSPNDKNENESGLGENMNQISCGNYFILYNFYIYRNKNG